MKELIYREGNKRERIDVYLKDRLKISREKIKGFLKEGRISVNGVAVGPSYYLRDSDRVEISEDFSVLDEMHVEAQEGILEILHEDSSILVINKPSGLVTHPTHAVFRGTLLNYAIYHTRLAGGVPLRLGIVHRLDRETSGVIVLSKTELAYESLVTQFKNRQVNKEYLALVKGRFFPASRNIEFTVYPDRKEHTTMEIHYLRGKKTFTRVDAVRYIECMDITLVRAKPVTGRTHQVRLALSSTGYPIIGDRKYGVISTLINRVALHAYRISFMHPETGARVVFTAPLPSDLSAIIKPEFLKNT